MGMETNLLRPETVLALQADRGSEGMTVRTMMFGSTSTVRFVQAKYLEAGDVLVEEDFVWNPGKLRLRLVQDVWTLGDDVEVELTNGGGFSTSMGNMVMVVQYD